MTRLLAIDPGTYIMGLALFEGPDLVDTQSLEPAPHARHSVETRLAWLMAELTARVRGWGIEAIAMERPGASNPAHRPASLLTLCTFIRQKAKREWHIPLTPYATGTITKAVAPRGWPGDRKEKLRAGVVALYGESYGLRLQHAPQDVIDAIAVGHCHLCKIREKELLEHG